MKNFLAVLALAAAAIGARAQTVTNASPTGGAAAVKVQEMSLKDCIQTALQNNFQVEIQRESVAIQRYGLAGDYGGYDPVWNLSGTHAHNNLGAYTQVPQTNGTISYLVVPTISDQNTFKSDIGGASTPWGMNYDLFGNVAEATANTPGSPESINSAGQVGATVTQPLLKNFWIDSTRLTISLAKNSLQQSEEGLRLQFITTVAAVQNAYYQLIYAQDNVKVQQEALTLAQTQLDQDRQRVQVGSLAPLDVQQDEAQAASSQANLITAWNTLSVDQNTLKAALISDYAHWHDITIQPNEALNADLQTFDLQQCWSKGLTKRPELVQARLTVEAQGITLKFDRNQLYPSLDLNASYGYNGVGRFYSGAFDQYADANHPFYSYGAAMSIPLSNIKARNALKSDKATLRQQLLTLKQLEQSIMVAIDNAVQQVASDYQNYQATKQARIYAEAALDAEQKKYNVGKSTTFTVLQLQNTLTTDRGNEIQSIAKYNEDIAALSQQKGTTLEDLNIGIEVK